MAAPNPPPASDSAQDPPQDSHQDDTPSSPEEDPTSPPPADDQLAPTASSPADPTSPVAPPPAAAPEPSAPAATERTAFGDAVPVVSPSPLPASPTSAPPPALAPPPPTRTPSPSSSPASSAPPPAPLKRPSPPKKGILKPARPPPRGLLNTLIRPSAAAAAAAGNHAAASVVSRFLDGGGPTGAGAAAPPPFPASATASPSSSAGAAGAVLQQGGERAGAFFSKAFTRLSSVAAGALPLAASSPVGNPPPVPPKPTSSSSAPAPAPAPAAPSPPAPTPAGPSLRKASFPLSHPSITYSISSLLPPSSPQTAAQIAEVERAHGALRAGEGGAEWWTAKRVGEAFEWACRVRDEGVDEVVLRALKAAAPPPPVPRTLDLSTHALTSHFTLLALSDVLSLPFSLSTLLLSSTSLTDASLTHLLTALLRPASLRALTLKDNRRLRLDGWRALARFLAAGRSEVRFVDLSENPLDRRTVEVLLPALQAAPPPPPPPTTTPTAAAAGEGEAEQAPKTKTAAGAGGVETVRLDGCALRGGALEALAQGIRTSTVRHLSLRANRIPSLGGVSLAVMIKDYPDAASSAGSSPFASRAPPANAASADGKGETVTVGYTPYTPRSRRAPPPSSLPSATSPSTTAAVSPGPSAAKADADEALPAIPSVASNSTGGITRRVVPDGYRRPGMSSSSSSSSSTSSTSSGSDSSHDDDARPPANPSSASASTAAAGLAQKDPDRQTGRMMRSRLRALDDVARVGRLVTLDLKGNDLRSGVTYVAQVLKRNRTLRVLNLADNKIDVAGLGALAEALKYNATLDTLDLSGNACCGPALEGIHALRHAFTLNSNLSRLLLSSTSLSTAGAIALAEFLPEATHLLHLDLTANEAIGTAGVMALAVGLRANKIVRCLDLSVAVGDEVGLGWSRDILQSCIRNTEIAQDKSLTKAARLAVWQPIQKSALARLAKAADSARALAEVAAEAATPAGQARVAVFELRPEEVEEQAEQAVMSLSDGVEVGDALGVVVVADLEGVVERAKVLRERLEEMVRQAVDGDGGDRLQVLLGLTDRLTAELDRAERALKDAAAVAHERARAAALARAKAQAAAEQARADALARAARTPPSSSSSRNAAAPGGLFPPGSTSTPTKNGPSSAQAEPLSSPNFSIGDSDDDDGGPADDGASSSGSDDDERALAIPSSTTTAAPEASTTAESPTGRKSLRWVEEEGEVFRKGVVLGAADVGDEDEDGADATVSGEQLKKELLDMDVERQSPRRLSVDETSLPLTAEST